MIEPATYYASKMSGHCSKIKESVATIELATYYASKMSGHCCKIRDHHHQKSLENTTLFKHQW